MTEPYDPAAEDQRRKDGQRAHLEASAANSTAEALELHRAVSGRLRARHEGMYGSATGADLAAVFSDQNARIGDGVGAGRELQRLGGTDFESQGAGAVAPVPHRADLTRLHAPPGYQRTENPLKHRNDGGIR